MNNSALKKQLIKTIVVFLILVLAYIIYYFVSESFEGAKRQEGTVSSEQIEPEENNMDTSTALIVIAVIVVFGLLATTISVSRSIAKVKRMDAMENAENQKIMLDDNKKN